MPFPHGPVRFLFFVFFLLAVVSGCTSKPSPLDEFKTLAAKFSSQLAMAKFADGNVQVTMTNSNFAYDVKKTDSLVSPFLAEFRFDCKNEFDTGPVSHRKITARYAYQDGKWVYKGYDSIGRGGPERFETGSGSTDGPMVVFLRRTE